MAQPRFARRGGFLLVLAALVSLLILPAYAL